MPLPYKPHSVSVYAPSHKSVGGVPGLLEHVGAAIVRAVQITPMSASAAFDRLGVDVIRPHLLLDDETAAPTYQVNSKVVWGGRTFFVVSPPEVFVSVVQPASHLSVVIREDK